MRKIRVGQEVRWIKSIHGGSDFGTAKIISIDSGSNCGCSPKTETFRVGSMGSYYCTNEIEIIGNDILAILQAISSPGRKLEDSELAELMNLGIISDTLQLTDEGKELFLNSIFRKHQKEFFEEVEILKSKIDLDKLKT